ncbi:LacI family DNA-binding transcriptional regulator [Streptomyces sp. NPDC059063]|uniref:LacI family DNA-binding transcriptional regulator n=1 Tax=unclassified Streptomyces TaxID=2593676 RepID=UPI00367DB909
MSRGGANPTLRDVALLAGVSTMTVSRVLHGASRVASTTRQRVLAAVAACGYRPNELARSLRRQSDTGLIGLLVPDLSRSSCSRLAVGIDAQAAQHGLRVIVCSTGQSKAKEKALVDELLARRVDGIVAVPCGGDQQHLSAAPDADVPVVLAHDPPEGFTADCVLVDGFGGARDATMSLLLRGHHRIGLLTTAAAGHRETETLRGYTAVMNSAGLPARDWVRLFREAPGGAEHAAVDLLTLPCPPTALLCSSPLATASALRAVQRRGTNTDLAGFLDSDLAADLPLTVITYDAQELGRTACRLLIDRIQGKEDSHARSGINTAPRPSCRLHVPTRLMSNGD